MRAHPTAPFIGLCFYLVSQGMTVPIIAIGNWAVWPALPDFAWLTLVVLSIPHLHRERSHNKGIVGVFLAGLAGCVGSYTVFTLLWPVLYDPLSAKGTVVGVYQTYRLSQFVVVFWLATKVGLTEQRIRIVHWLSLGTCVFVCLSCLATYFLVPTSFFGGHLIASVNEAGPWAPYIRGVQHMGVGATNINHAYTGMQVILLAAIVAHTRRPSMLPAWLTLLSLLTVLVSEHRTGLIFLALYACVLFRPSPKQLLSAAAVVLLTAAIVLFTWADTQQALYDAIQRHSTILSSYSTDGFSSRNQIWGDRLDFLNSNYARWLIGSGFGSAMESGQNAHMLYLHIVVETGIFGLFAFLASMLKILRVLWRSEQSPRALFWVTVCLLGTGFTQETFYPVAAFGHFIGLFLCAVAIAIRSARLEQQREAIEVWTDVDWLASTSSTAREAPAWQ